MYKYFYLGGSSTWGASRGRGDFFYSISQFPWELNILLKRVTCKFCKHFIEENL